MAMPTVDFVHIDDESFRPTALPGLPDTMVSVRTLNADPATGARSVVVRCAPGTTIPAGRVDADLEMLTLSGTGTVGGAPVGRYCYLFQPAGSGSPAMVAGEHGLDVLVFCDTTPEFSPAAAGTDDGVIGPVHIAEVPWERPRTPDFPAGAGRKTLRDDPATGRAFWILAVLPHWSSPYTEWHTFTEENLVLEGEMQTAGGLMRAGGYLSHRAGPETAHGPMRSRAGALMITRACGPLGTTYRPADRRLTGPWW